MLLCLLPPLSYDWLAAHSLPSVLWLRPLIKHIIVTLNKDIKEKNDNGLNEFKKQNWVFTLRKKERHILTGGVKGLAKLLLPSSAVRNQTQVAFLTNLSSTKSQN